MNHDKVEAIQRLLRQAGFRGWLLYNFRGLNPIAQRLAPLPSEGLLTRRWAYWIPAQGDPAWLVHAIERGSFAHRGERVVPYSSWRSFETGLLELTAGAGRIACEYSPGCSIPYASFLDAGSAEQFRSLGYELHSSADLVQAVYATWTPKQLAMHRRAAEVCLAAKNAAFSLIAGRLAAQTNVTENDVQGFLMDWFVREGIDPDHPPIVAVNSHAGDPHYAPRPDHPTAIQKGDLILIDLWGRVANDPESVFADMTWMGYAGTQPPSQMQDVLAVVAKARDAALGLIEQRIAAGVPLAGWEVDDVARGVITAAGYGDYFIHRTGHSLDTSIHGSGANIDNLETRDTRLLIPNLGFTLEPGIYLPEFGVRLEINVYIHPDRAEVTTLPLQQQFITMDISA